MIGEPDETVNVAKNIEAFAATRQRNPDIDYRLVPKADHALIVGGQFAGGFPDLIADWILGLPHSAR